MHEAESQEGDQANEPPPGDFPPEDEDFQDSAACSGPRSSPTGSGPGSSSCAREWPLARQLRDSRHEEPARRGLERLCGRFAPDLELAELQEARALLGSLWRTSDAR